MVTSGQLRAARCALGLTQARFARLLHVSPSSIARWEAGAFASVPAARAEVLERAERHLRNAGITFALEPAGVLVIRIRPTEHRHRRRSAS